METAAAEDRTLSDLQKVERDKRTSRELSAQQKQEEQANAMKALRNTESEPEGTELAVQQMEIALDDVEEAQRFAALSAVLDRAIMAKQMGMQYGGNRDLYQEFGYLVELGFEDYQSRYDREGLSARIVDKPATDTWASEPIITDGDEEETEFLNTFSQLEDRLRLWKYLTDLDRAAGLGEFAVMLIGAKGDTKLSEPLEKVSSLDELIYLRVFDQGETEINSIDRDPSSARFGLPVIYSLDMGEVENSPLPEERVHWSRIIHVAEDSRDGVYGRPRLRRSFNRLFDMDKIVGSSAEAFWRLVLKGLVVTNEPGYKIEPGSEAKLEDKFLQYVHHLKRVLVLSGAQVNELGSSEEPDPGGAFKVLISLIAADIDMPQNILIGSEQGVRASDVDAQTWARSISSRQTKFAEPVILRPFIDWIIAHGAVPPPKSGQYEIEWPSLYTMTELEEIEVGTKKADTLAKLASSGALELALATRDEARDWVKLAPDPLGESVDDLLDIEDAMPEEMGDDSDAE